LSLSSEFDDQTNSVLLKSKRCRLLF